MEDEHRYFPTPTQERPMMVAPRHSNQRYPHSAAANSQTTSANPLRFDRKRGNKKFVNSRTFSTLTTKLSANTGQSSVHRYHPMTACQETDSLPGNTAPDLDSLSGKNPTNSKFVRRNEARGESECDSSPAYARSVSETPINATATTPASPFLFPSYPNIHKSSVPGKPAHNQPYPQPYVTSEQKPMGKLLKSASPVFGHTDSFGFRLTKADAPSKHPTYQAARVGSQSANAGSGDTHTDQHATCGQINEHLMEVHDSAQLLDSGQTMDGGQESTKQSQTESPHGAVVADGDTVQTQDTAIPLTTSDQLSKTESTQPQEDFQFQKPLPMSSPTRRLPPFRRQLSKRKSEIFGIPLPQKSTGGNDEDTEDSDEEDDDDDFYSLGGSTGRRSDPCTPTSPKTRRLLDYDPYQIFEVQHTPCLILTVRVLRGRNITMGFQDFYDTPDPYVNLIMRSSPEGRKTTTVKENNTSPVWNETFTFFINFTQANVLEITLMESNLLFDQQVGTVYFDVVEIKEMEKPQLETFVFNQVSQIDIEFKLEFDRHPTLRYSLCLSEQEKAFIERRKQKALEGMKRLLGEEKAPLNTDEVPTIAVIGSGGGFRAMTGYSGVFKALRESGVLDCTTYAGGLSGSSWLLSTLYSHPKWPDLDMNEFLEELKNSVDKSLLRFLNVSTMYQYAKYMVQKRKEGQPVSFTDIFGRMVGETLLSQRMEATLTDQREKLKDGEVPMPLYTCVHVKKDVPARSFQEWVEFSPYEIGMPKYGTFMDSKLFGSKFFMGKMVKEFKEQPLHFLQGIWGSAFCILFKRLLEDNRRIDPVEMVRQEMGKQLDEAREESSSDCSDDEVDEESSYEESSSDNDKKSDDDIENDSQSNDDDRDSDDMQAEDGEHELKPVSSRRPSVYQRFPPFDERANMDDEEMERQNSADSETQEHIQMERRRSSSAYSTDVEIDEDTGDGDSAYVGEEDGYEDEDDLNDETDRTEIRGIMKRGSIELARARQTQHLSKDSASPENGTEMDPLERSEVSISDLSASQASASLTASRKSVNWGACPTRGNKNGSIETQRRRQAFLRAGSSLRKSRSGSKGYWRHFIKGVFESNSWELLSTRRGRAAVIHNFMRGLSLQQTYPLSPFTPLNERVKEGDEFDGIFEMHPTSVKHIYMVDAGLTFNSPYPLILRPQREVDIILSYDFSARPADQSQPFKELLLAEKWARLNRLPFPPIDASVFEREGMKELYIFRHPTDPHCPVVFHFVLVNQTFKYYKKPGVPRETKEEFEFADFDVFDDPKAPYSTFNFTYKHDSFERLSQLMEFNTLLHIEDIKEVIQDVIRIKREGPPRVPIQSKDIKLLRMKSVQEVRKLRKFITRMESRNSLYSGTSPSSPFYTPTPHREVSSNPFFAGFNRDTTLYSSSNDEVVFSTPRDRLSESFRHGCHGKKHLHPPHLFSESAEFSYLASAQKELGKSDHSRNSSFESVFGTPPKTPPRSPHFVPNFSPTTESATCQNGNEKQQIVDVIDGPLNVKVTESAVGPECAENTNHQSDSAEVSENSSPSQPSNPDPSPTVTTATPQTPSRRPMLSPRKVKIPGTTFTFPDSNGSTGTSDSGVGSLGPGTDSSRSGQDSLGFITARTPGTGTFSSGSSGVGSGGSAVLSGQILSKGKSKKEQPPNPFFAKAHFMRSAYNTSSSASSSSSHTALDNGGDQKAKTAQGSSYRLISPQPSPEIYGIPKATGRVGPRSLAVSPLATEAAQSSLSPVPKNTTPPSTPDIYSLAPEAFKLDGTPVFDSDKAKMYYDSAKEKRKILRRQSTISSLKSISLDESEPPSSGGYNAGDSSACDSEENVGPEEPQKQKVLYSDNHFRDFFYTCDEMREGERTTSSNSLGENDVFVQGVVSKSDYGVDFEIKDLRKFSRMENSDSNQVAGDHQRQLESQTSEVWFDAVDNNSA